MNAQSNVVIKRRGQSNISRTIWNNIVWILLIFAIVIMGLIDPVFFNVRTLMNIFVQGSILGILAVAIGFSLLIAEIDLSIVGIAALSACLGTLAMSHGLNWILAILMIVFSGIIMGVINGLLIAKLKAVSLIATLAFQITYLGAVMAITQGQSIINFPLEYKFIGQGRLFSTAGAGESGFPIVIIVFLLVFLAVHYVWTRTAFGRSLYAIGGNAASAKVSGIKVDKVKIIAFTVCGGLAGFAGFVLSSYMGAVTNTFGEQYKMYSIAAAVIGGVSLSGGKGTVFGVLGGTLLLQVMQIGLQVLGISSYSVNMIGGLMILVAVIIDAFRNRLGEAK